MRALDAALTLLLVFGLPAHALFRSFSKRPDEPADRTRTYLRTIAVAIVLDAILAALWLSNGRPLSDLGLGWNLGTGGQVGMAIALGTPASLALIQISRKRKPKSAREVEAEALMPATARETAIFVLFAVVIGASWEVLFRGYLLWSLTPKIGLVASVAVAATAYGAAHGYKDPRRFGLSILAAFVFTIAYVVSGSLWWLIVLHIGLPALGALFVTYERRREARLAALASV